MPFWFGWMVIFQALVGCHDILILGKSPIKWRQRPDMTVAVDWDVKHQFKQKKTCILYPVVSTTAKYTFIFYYFGNYGLLDTHVYLWGALPM